MFTPFPTLQQGCQTLQWSEALGLGLSSHPQLTLIWEMAGLYFEQRDVSHLGARTSPPLPKHHSPRVLSQRLFSSGLQKLPGPFKLLKTSEPPKSKSYFPFLPHRWLYIAPHTIANLGGLNPWTGLVYCLNTRPHAATSRSHKPQPPNWELPAGRGPQRERGNQSSHFKPHMSWCCCFFAG